MSSDAPPQLPELSTTFPLDNDSDDANIELLSSSSSPPPSSSSSPLILYKPPTIWSLVRGAAINLLLPFVNGLMLGFGELFAHEAAYRLGWSGTKVIVKFPGKRLQRSRTHRGVFLLTGSHADISQRSCFPPHRPRSGAARRSGGKKKEKWGGIGHVYQHGVAHYEGAGVVYKVEQERGICNAAVHEKRESLDHVSKQARDYFAVRDAQAFGCESDL